MERYTVELLQPQMFAELPVKFRYELSQFGDTVSCHLRTTQGVVRQAGELVTWFEKLGEEEQAKILGTSLPGT
jgi:hypothetical protein